LAFDGTVIVVSHDREFLDGLVTKVYEFGGGCVREHIGGIYDFLKKKDVESLENLSSVLPKQQTKREVLKVETPSEGKLSYEQQKERSKLLKKAEAKVQAAEREVERIEQEIAQKEALLATPDGASSMQLFEEYASLKKQLNNAVEAWELAMEAYAELS
jgi:ATP-binding cassette subfamily F protein 3